MGVQVVLSRKGALRLAWGLIQMASGSSKVGLIINDNPFVDERIVIKGKKLLQEEN